MVDFSSIGKFFGLQPQTPDGFEVAKTDPLFPEHTLITRLLEAASAAGYCGGWMHSLPLDHPATVELENLDDAGRQRLFQAIIPRLILADRRANASRSSSDGAGSDYAMREKVWVLCEIIDRLVDRKLLLPEAEVLRLTDWLGTLDQGGAIHVGYPVAAATRACETLAGAQPLSEPFKASLVKFAGTLRSDHPYARNHRKYAERIDAISGLAPRLLIEPGEAWADAALADYGGMTEDQRRAWVELIIHCSSATAGKPTGKWLAKARRLFEAGMPFADFKAMVLRWFALVGKPRTRIPSDTVPEWADFRRFSISDMHTDILRGLAWMAGLREDRDLARALSALALASYKNWHIRIGNGCVCALGMMPGRDGIAQLALLRTKTKFGAAQKEIEKALAAAARHLKMSPGDLEEISAPTYGLEQVGEMEAAMGEFTARLNVEGDSVRLSWINADGKKTASVPAAVKRDHAEALKQLKATAKDIEKMLPAQRARIESLFLRRKSWPYAQWRERYCDHPLVGTLARRLIWRFAAGVETRAGIFHAGQITGRDGKPISGLDENMRVELWHPLDRSQEEILAWREWLETHQVRQPFKQAHREIYLLTDAERRTGVYSNRFAAHLIKQHQFKALCGARGWKYQLRLPFGDHSDLPASVSLPEWNLRAEFWVEAAPHAEGTAASEPIAYPYLSTDQVRFYPLAAPTLHEPEQPLPLEQIPPLAFSEVMRDVDLFVGVASVGNDPAWADGGPQGRYRDYWQGYSFGDLSNTAKTRKEILERLVPRLKIASRCSFSERFLVVRGDIRSYKIHLGSGNILMTPKDQYLCIVPQASAAERSEVFLPFEGDRLLSVILSKAFLLAADAKIKDPTIISQIKA